MYFLTVTGWTHYYVLPHCTLYFFIVKLWTCNLIFLRCPVCAAVKSYRGEKKTMELEAMVFWQIFVAIFIAGNQLGMKHGKKFWISKLEYRQHIR